MVKAIKATRNQKATDIIFHLLDWSGNARKGIVGHMIKTKNDARREGEGKSMATQVASDFGLSYFVTNNFDEPWKPDPELEVTFKEELAKMKTTRPIPLNPRDKIGRNQPCPCQSGKKYKHCCLP